ncbi:hypothetical protein GX441_12090 [bacterium]|nr:hypothetical protein [bacterium]
MKKTILVLISTLLVFALGCRKPEPTAPHLVIILTEVYTMGRFVDNTVACKTVDSVFLKPDEKVLLLKRRCLSLTSEQQSGYCYLWNEEDTIDYYYRDGFLWVGGKLSGGYLDELLKLEDDQLKDVQSVSLFYDSEKLKRPERGFLGFTPAINAPPQNLRRFPRLSYLDMYLTDGKRAEPFLDSLKLLDKEITIDCQIGEPTGRNIRQLLAFPNLRRLSLWMYKSDRLADSELMQLRHARNLERLMIGKDPRLKNIKRTTIERLHKILPDCYIDFRDTFETVIITPIP